MLKNYLMVFYLQSIYNLINVFQKIKPIGLQDFKNNGNLSYKGREGTFPT